MEEFKWSLSLRRIRLTNFILKVSTNIDSQGNPCISNINSYVLALASALQTKKNLYLMQLIGYNSSLSQPLDVICLSLVDELSSYQNNRQVKFKV